ncbi:14085_t:CDS:2, partial [Dentiscutata erythropus]
IQVLIKIHIHMDTTELRNNIYLMKTDHEFINKPIAIAIMAVIKDKNCYTLRDITLDNPLDCYVLKNNSVDSLNGLSSLNLPNIYRDHYGFIMDSGLSLRNGSQCQCGNYANLTPSYTTTTNSICNITCISNSSYYCGGEESYTVYETKDGVLGHPLPTISITDKIAIIENHNNDNQYQQCIKNSPFCNQRILNGTKLELAMELNLSSDEYSSSCADDINQICGDTLAFSIYSTSNNIPLQIILPCVFAGVLLLALIAVAA